jgi:hypothetical protein
MKKKGKRNAEIALPDGPHSDNCVSIVGITVIIAGISVVRMKVFSIPFLLSAAERRSNRFPPAINSLSLSLSPARS